MPLTVGEIKKNLSISENNNQIQKGIYDTATEYECLKIKLQWSTVNPCLQSPW